jgi:hypothetical protein
LVWNPHIPSSNVYDGLFPWDWGSQDMQFAIHFHLLPRSRLLGVIYQKTVQWEPHPHNGRCSSPSCLPPTKDLIH